MTIVTDRVFGELEKWERMLECNSETLIKLIPLMVQRAHHERNHVLTVGPEPVEGLDQYFLSELFVEMVPGLRIGFVPREASGIFPGKRLQATQVSPEVR